jgi:hypothetical protein
MKHLFFVLALVFVTSAHGQALVVSACGAGAYPVGQLHQLTMNPAGYLCVSTTTLLGTATEGQGPPSVAPKATEPPKLQKPLALPPEPAK